MREKFNRRNFLRSAGTGVALTSFAGLANAKNPPSASDIGEPTESMFPIVFQNGQAELVVSGKRSKKLSSQDVISQFDTDGRGVRDGAESIRDSIKASLQEGKPVTGEDAAYLLAKAVEMLNEAIKQGYLNVKNQADGRKLETTQKFEQEVKSVQNNTDDIGTFGGCGTSKYELDGPGWFDPYYNHKFYTDDEDTQELKYRCAQSTVTAAFIAGLCGVAGVTAPLTVAALIISFISGMLVAEYSHENEGCGCVTEIKHLPAPPTVAVPNLTYDFSVWSQ